MEKTLVTGANGHIGSNLVRELLARGYEVSALVRETSDLRGLTGCDVRLIRADVRDADKVAQAVAGHALVFHAATPYLTWARDPQSIVGPALTGVENVLRAAAAAGTRRVVLTSSCNAVGFTLDPAAPLDERSWNTRTRSPYIRAKNEQERRAHALAAELSLDLVAVLPTTVLGPHDYRKTPTTAPFVDVLAGKAPVPFAMNLVDVRDVARGHVLAAEKGARGERYLLGGDNVDVATLAGLIEKLTGRRPGEGLPPMWILRAVAAVSEAAAALSGKPPAITRAVLDDVAGGCAFFDVSKARDALGFRARGAEEVVLGALEWARSMGWIRGGAASSVAAST